MALLVGFQAGLAVLAEDISRKSLAEDMPAVGGFMLVVGMTALAVLWEMLFFGFLRTAAREGARPVEPVELLRTGRIYFWRVFLCQAVLSIGYIGLSGLILAGLSGVLKIDDIEKMPQWAIQAASFAAIVLLIKPTLVLPSAMIVCDCSAMDAIRAMRRYVMIKDRQLMVLIGAGLAAAAAATFAASLTRGGIAYYPVIMICSAVSGLALLAMFVAVSLRFEQVRDKGEQEP